VRLFEVDNTIPIILVKLDIKEMLDHLQVITMTTERVENKHFPNLYQEEKAST
jgi:hypothetical protein